MQERRQKNTKKRYNDKKHIKKGIHEKYKDKEKIKKN